jgi:hypothetical protein
VKKFGKQIEVKSSPLSAIDHRCEAPVNPPNFLTRLSQTPTTTTTTTTTATILITATTTTTPPTTTTTTRTATIACEDGGDDDDSLFDDYFFDKASRTVNAPVLCAYLSYHILEVTHESAFHCLFAGCCTRCVVAAGCFLKGCSSRRRRRAIHGVNGCDGNDANSKSCWTSNLFASSSNFVDHLEI